MLRHTTLSNIDSDDGGRLEIIATGLSFAQGAPLGCDATMVSPLHANGTPWPRAHEVDGVAIQRAEEDKWNTYWDLMSSPHCQLTILACETGGRWSDTCRRLVNDLAKRKSREAPERLQQIARSAWRTRWWRMLSVAAQSSLSATLVDDAVQLLDGTDGDVPDLVELLDCGTEDISRLALR